MNASVKPSETDKPVSRLNNDSILFANENPSFLMYVGVLVKRLGYKVYLALDGIEAVKIAKERRPSIIMLDFNLSKLDGISCLNMIRSDANLRGTPVIMLFDEDSIHMDEAGRLDIQSSLKKPLNINDFYIAIQKCLHHSIKRKNVRVPLKLKVNVSCRGEDREFFASNLSAEGMFLRTASSYPVGTELDIVMTIDDDDPIELKATVASAQKSPSDIQAYAGMGIRFTEMPEDTRYRIHFFVMKELTKDISVGDGGPPLFDDSLNID